jgi:hypothetical protein
VVAVEATAAVAPHTAVVVVAVAAAEAAEAHTALPVAAVTGEDIVRALRATVRTSHATHLLHGDAGSK